MKFFGRKMERLELLIFFGFIACLLFSSHGTAFADWPASTKGSKGDSSGWPVFEKRDGAARRTRGPTSGGSSRPGADNLLCAFDYLRAARAISHFRIGRSGRPICPAEKTNYGSYFSGDRLKALEDLIKQAGVRRDRIVAVEKPGFQNAAAVLCEGRNGEIKRLIIWDPEFLGELDRKTGTPWASVAVLAHEIAHHLNLDTGQQRRPKPAESRKQELFADWYAGAKLRQLGASRRQAVAVFYHMGAGGSSHPPARQRVAAAGRGWDESDGDRKPEYNPPDRSDRDTSRLPSQRRDDTYRTPQPQHRIATICVTPVGFCRNNPMLGRVLVGGRCACYTPVAVFRGIGR